MSEITSVGVVGAGLMGGGIAQVAAAAGYPTTVRDVSEDLLARGRQAIERSLAKLVEKDATTRAAADEALSRIRWTTELGPVADADLVIEAITEELRLKQELWRALDAAAPERALFASNTSSLPVAALAAVTRRPDRFAGVHFFNPVPLMPLVEIVRAVGTSEQTLDVLTRFVRHLGKEPLAARDTPGFIVNRLLVPYLMDAVRALEGGVASTRDLDLGMKLGCGHPMGPLTLIDLIGVDTALRVGEAMYEEFRESRYAPPPLLRRMVAAGLLGRKAGRGFYDYGANPPEALRLA